MSSINTPLTGEDATQSMSTRETIHIVPQVSLESPGSRNRWQLAILRVDDVAHRHCSGWG